MQQAFPIRPWAVLLSIVPLTAIAQTTAPPAPDTDTTPLLSPIEVTATRPGDMPAGATQPDKDKLPAWRASTSDTARLLEDIPGVSSYGAGGISSLPVVRGLADDRLRTIVDGMDLMTACPNHMNPALSFIDPSKVASVAVFAGITPVSVGGDSIGGTIQVDSAPPKFASAEQGILAEGELSYFTRSNGNARGNSGRVMLANQWLNFSYSESKSNSDNYEAADDFKKPGFWKALSAGRKVEEREVGASEYRNARNRELSLALQPLRNHILALSVSEQKLDYEGFPNQRMDMISSEKDTSFLPDHVWTLADDKPSNVNRLANVRYTGQYEWGGLEARYFRQKLEHHMDFLPERYIVTPYMPMDTVATTTGGLLKANIDLSDTDILRIGYDFQKYRLDDWWPPIGFGPGSMCCNDFWNIRDGKRDRQAVFGELESQWNSRWLTLLGIRLGTVKSDAASVQGYSNIGAYRGDAARFNALDHKRKDEHVDWTALLRHTPDETQTYEAGLARKTRSPNLYERYPWSYFPMAALMNNFVGDGNGYIGNPDLKPEVAHSLSISGDWHSADKERWGLKITGYVTDVDNFIDARRAPGYETKDEQYVLLQYTNVRARLFGIDVSAHRLLGRLESIGSFTATGSVSYVRGENRSTGDDLYHIMPLNTKLALAHRLGGWSNTLEVQVVDDKTRVSKVRNEMQTPGYTLVNLRTSYEWKYARVDIALENALDEFYLLPLGGAYLGQGNTMTTGGVPWGMNVPGRGRSLNMALSLRF
ncbi:MAG: TonB-dependent receptor [Dechloromonas sp.]|nr:MAG: TonB-dependent receptor [Dechloromonas sp.]